MTKFVYRMVLVFSLAASGAAGAGGGDQGDRSDHNGDERARFEFALIGDTPYDAVQMEKALRMQQQINAARLAFVVHDGDFKSGSSLCSEETFVARKELFDAFAHPFVFIPGDNEWTDCHRANNGGYDPIERLARLRTLFFADDYSLGQRKIKLMRQSEDSAFAKFRENVRWQYGDVMFVGLNIPGSNNNFGRTPAADAEYAERNVATLKWMQQAFELAKRERSRAIMLVIQANPGFDLPPTHPERTGYNEFLAALAAHTLAFGKPVVLVHGDSHYFRIDKPMLRSTDKTRVDNFTRVETFGSPDVNWLRVAVDPRDPNVFVFKQALLDLAPAPRAD